MPKKRQRREDWRARAKEMRSDFRDEFSNANRTQYAVGDPAPTPTDAPGGHGQRAQLARKLAARGDMRNQQLYDFVQKQGTTTQPGDPGAPGTNPDPGYLPPDDQTTMFNSNPNPGSQQASSSSPYTPDLTNVNGFNPMTNGGTLSQQQIGWIRDYVRGLGFYGPDSQWLPAEGPIAVDPWAAMGMANPSASQTQAPTQASTSAPPMKYGGMYNPGARSLRRPRR